jgi:hypothetical protein
VLVSDEERQFRIMEIFLIYHDGLLMKHISHEDMTGELVDEDIFGGMLTAIKSFIEDSFKREGGLKTLQYGKLNIFIERGPQMFLAVVFQGEAPKGLRPRMRYLLIDIYDHYSVSVKHWDGSSTSIEGIEELLARLFEVEEE